MIKSNLKKELESHTKAELIDMIIGLYKLASDNASEELELKKKTISKNLIVPNFLQLKISLDGIKPVIWRRVVIDPTLSLEDMNEVILGVMPWVGYHLHQFYNNEITATPPSDDPFDESDGDYNNLTIGDFIKKVGDKCNYLYDFGDNWEHTIIVEKLVHPIPDSRAKFITGKNMTPPEDCGGIWGFKLLIRIMQDPKHPEHNNMRKWLGLTKKDIFDPKDMNLTAEDITSINNWLSVF